MSFILAVVGVIGLGLVGKRCYQSMAKKDDQSKEKDYFKSVQFYVDAICVAGLIFGIATGGILVGLAYAAYVVLIQFVVQGCIIFWNLFKKLMPFLKTE